MRLPWPDWMDEKVFNVSLASYAEAFLTFALVWIALWFCYRLSHKGLHYLKSKNGRQVAPLAHGLLMAVRPGLFPAFGFMVALRYITLSRDVGKVLNGIIMLLVVFQAVGLVQVLIRFGVNRINAGDGSDLKSRNMRKNLTSIFNGALWIAAVLFLLDNYGVNISTFVAGLGVGGIAVALAAQAILGDTFSSFIISIDKPFEVGDTVSVDDMVGTVEHIGLKTTRVRSVGGELLIFANSDMTKSRIRNFKRMLERRVLFNLRLVHGTAPEKLRQIPEMVREVVEALPDVRFDRAHLATIGPESLDFEVVYWVRSADFMMYRDIHQAVNLGILKAFAERSLEFAIPGRYLHVNAMQVSLAKDKASESPVAP